jgi:hypothetical protein
VLPPEQDRLRVGVNPKAPQHFHRDCGVALRIRRIILDATDFLDALVRNAETFPSLDVAAFLRADEIETTKRRRNNATEPPETPLRALR